MSNRFCIYIVSMMFGVVVNPVLSSVVVFVNTVVPVGKSCDS
jgi:hypothetical protein